MADKKLTHKMEAHKENWEVQTADKLEPLHGRGALEQRIQRSCRQDGAWEADYLFRELTFSLTPS